MLFEDDPRDVRKKEFIKKMKMKKVWELVDPLAEKIEGLRQGEVSAEEVFKKAGYVGRYGEKLIGDFKKRPDVILAGIAMDENLIMTSVGELGVSVRVGNVTGVFSDAIVNFAASDGSMAGGPAAAIKEEGGEEIEKESVSKAPITGDKAVDTGSGKLTCENIIHVGAKEEGGGVTPDSLKRAVTAALALAEELELNTIAIPALGSESGGPAAEELAGAVMEAIVGHKAEEVASIILVAESEETARAYASAAEKLEE